MQMTCSNCGKVIPFVGKVCPYCHANKEEDKKAVSANVSYFGGAFLGAVGGGMLAVMAKWGEFGLFLSVFVGLWVGLGIGYLEANRKAKKP